MIVHGIGYQGLTLQQFVDRLSLAGVRLLVDVRLNAISRKPGFSKTKLAEALDEAGIAYDHVRELGNEKTNRAGFGYLSGDDARQARDTYRRHLCNGSTPVVDNLVETVRDTPTALMCYEHDELYCHREVLIDHLQDIEPKLLRLAL